MKNLKRHINNYCSKRNPVNNKLMAHNHCNWKV